MPVTVPRFASTSCPTTWFALSVVRRVVPGSRSQGMARPERQRRAGLGAPRPTPAGSRTQRAAARDLGRGAVAHALVRGHQRRLLVGPLLRQRPEVAIAGRGEAVGAFERAPVVAIVGGRRDVVRQAAPHLELTVQVAARLERPAEHLAAPHALRLEREVAAQDLGAAHPILVDQMCIGLVERHLRVARGRSRLHRLIEPVGQHDVAATRVDARQPELLHLRGGRLADLQLGQVVLAPRLLVAPEDVERLAAQIVNLGIPGVVLEVMRAVERGDRVVELSGGRRGARGVALRGRVARQLLQHLFELAARLVELPCRRSSFAVLRSCSTSGDASGVRQPQYSNHQLRHPITAPPVFATVVPAADRRPRRCFCRSSRRGSRRRNAFGLRSYHEIRYGPRLLDSVTARPSLHEVHRTEEETDAQVEYGTDDGSGVGAGGAELLDRLRGGTKSTKSQPRPMIRPRARGADVEGRDSARSPSTTSSGPRSRR